MENNNKARSTETVLVIMLGFVVLFLVYKKDWMLYIPGSIALLSLLSATVAYYINKFWYLLAEILGAVMNRLIMGSIFVLVLLPFGLLSQLFRKDMLGIKSSKNFDFVEKNKTYEPDDMEFMW